MLNEPSHDLLRLRAELASLSVELRLLDLALKAGFDPNQPRVPAGNTDGGQWTRVGGGTASALNSQPARTVASGGSATAQREGEPDEQVVVDDSGEQSWRSYVERRRHDGTAESRTVLNRDGSSITTEFGPTGASGADQSNTVMLADGSRFTFENQGTTQRIFDRDGKLISETVWTPRGPVAQPVLQSVAMNSAQADQLFGAARSLYDWLSTQNSPEVRACLAFKARDFQPTGSGSELVFVGLLPRAEVAKACERLGDVQQWTDTAAQKAGPPSDYSSPAVYGTKVHTLLKRHIDSLNDPELTAELALWKGLEESPIALGSIRIDVVEDHGTGPVCLYDIKTGKRGLSLRRAADFARRLSLLLRGRTMIVTEIRPFE